MEMSPVPEPRSASSLARGATIRPPVAANGCPTASDGPFTLSLARSRLPRRPGQHEPALAVFRVPPRLQGGQDLRRERLVDLVQVDVPEAQPGRIEQPGH